MTNIVIRTAVTTFARNFLNYKYGIRSSLPDHCNSVSSLAPNLRYFTKKHEWLSIDGNIGTIGISFHAQESLGDIVYVQLPNISDEVNTSDECGALESVKAASELYSPISGTVTEVNTALEEHPELVNTDCYGKGWLFKLKLKDIEEVRKLMNEDEYFKFIKSTDDTHAH